MLECGCPDTGSKCRCGCHTTLICPGKRLCRKRILALTGAEETKAVRAWMELGLCICGFVIKNLRRGVGTWRSRRAMPDRDYTKASGNWSAKCRRKLVRCPCGAYFDNQAVHALGLLSESEWKRRGYPNFKPGAKDYVDADVARWTSPFARRRLPDGSTKPITHVRRATPVARIWRPFYDFRTQRFCTGVYSVDLFGPDQVDFSRPLMSLEQALKIVEGWWPEQQDED
jgi:hypothetical protein